MFTNEQQGGLRPALLFVLLAALERYGDVNRFTIAGHRDGDHIAWLVILEMLHKVRATLDVFAVPIGDDVASFDARVVRTCAHGHAVDQDAWVSRCAVRRHDAESDCTSVLPSRSSLGGCREGVSIGVMGGFVEKSFAKIDDLNCAFWIDSPRNIVWCVIVSVKPSEEEQHRNVFAVEIRVVGWAEPTRRRRNG